MPNACQRYIPYLTTKSRIRSRIPAYIEKEKKKKASLLSVKITLLFFFESADCLK